MGLRIPGQALRKLAMLALLLLAVAACQLPRPFAAGESRTPAEPAGTSASTGRGRLVLEIRWPDRDFKGFKAALIPTSTNALAITVTTGSGATVAQSVIQREAGVATASATFELDTATNLGVGVKAYRAANPNLITDTAIAQGNAAGVTIAPSVETRVQITLTALFAPTIQAFNSYGGKVGDTVTLTGENLDVIGGANPIVKFNGTAASVSAQVTPITATSLQVVIPSGAAVGRVLVENDGVPSTSNAIFWVADQLTIGATKAEWDSKTAPTYLFLPSSTNSFTVTPSWLLSPGADAGSYGAQPRVVWEVSDGLAGSFDTLDRFVATDSVRSATAKAKLGTLESNALTADVQDVTVTLAPNQAALGAGQALTAAFTVTNTFSDATTNTLATLTPDSLNLVSMSGFTASKGSGAGNSSGTVTMTATLEGDTRRSATASLTLYNYASKTLDSQAFVTYAGSYAAVAGQIDGMVFDAAGDLYLAASASHKIAKVTTGGVVSVLAGTGTEGLDNGDAAAATFRSPTDVATGSGDAIYVADYGNSAIRKIVLGNVLTHLTLSVAPRGLVLDGQDNLYIAAGHCILKKVTGQSEAVFAGNCAESGATDATGADARFDTPRGLAFDSQGRLLVAETGRIRRITSGGVVSTLAGDGTCSDTVFEGTAATTKICPSDVAVDAADNVYVLGSSWLQVINTSGILTRLAGAGAQGGAGSFVDGTGSDVRFFGARAVAVDSSARPHVGDKDAVRRLTRVP